MPTAAIKDHHAIVVGAGIGGLVTALLLATKGIKVTLIEKAALPGGKMRQVNGVDSGPTVFTMRWILDQVFAAAGTTLEARLKLSKLDVLARHAWQPQAGEQAATLDLFADKSSPQMRLRSLVARPRQGGSMRFAFKPLRYIEL
jgi:1-hydroxycarotenoid 3,4-desaturase